MVSTRQYWQLVGGQRTAFTVAILIGWSVAAAYAQNRLTPPAPPAPGAPVQAGTSAPTAPASGQFAPGVLTTIAPDLQPEETVTTHDLIEITSNPAVRWEPQFLAPTRTLHARSADVRFRRDVWCLEFSFKPLRMLAVDVPQSSGRMQRKLILYMVYRVRNTGKLLKPVAQEGGVYAAELAPSQPIRFVPQFVLESQDRQPTGERVNKAYLDRVIPAALEPIRRREMRGQPLLTSIEMGEQLIAPSDERFDRSVWGVAMWEDIDPRIDFFSVFVGGLTNAYNWVDPPGAFQPGDLPGRGRRFVRKTLQLNFWRPGDEMLQDEREIRYGVPIGKAGLYDVPDGVAYRWLYR